MKPRHKKIIRDMTTDLVKNSLLVIAIALGVLAIGAMLGAYSVVIREMSRSYRSTIPASATIKVEQANIDSKIVEEMKAIPQIEAIERHATVSARMKVGENWMGLLLFVIDDFKNLKTNKFFRISGEWPPSSGSMLVEESALPVMQAKQGSSLLVRVANETARAVRISGVVHDAGLAPAWQERTGYGYITLTTLQQLGGTGGFNEIRVLLKTQNESIPEIENQANEVARLVASRGLTIREIQVPPPGRHPHQGQMNAVLMLFIVFSFLTLIFAAILVASSLSTLMARQIREIGMMKAIGASSSQVARLYLFTMIALSAIAVALAIPLSRIGASILIRSTARMLNIDIQNATMPFNVVIVQIITGMLIPLIASLVPLFNGSRITVREALNSYGVKPADFGRRRFDSLLSRAQFLNTNLTLAVRNVFRHRGRLWLTVGLLASGGTMFLTALNVSRAWDTNVDRIYQERLYDLEVRFAAPLRSPQETAKKIAALSGIRAAEPWQYSSMSFAQSGHYETNHSYPDSGHGRSFIFGVPPHTKMLNLPLLQGHWLDSADGSEVVMNRAALNSMGLKLGETVNLSIKGRISSWRVVGFVDEMGSPGATAYVPLAAYQRVVNEQACCNLLRVAFFDRSEKSTLQNSRPIESLLDRDQNAIASVFPMYELRRAISEHMTVLIRSLLALAILMAAIGGIGLASTMSVNVLERTRELGIMRAIGATPKMIGRIVLSEGLMIGAFSLFFAFGLSLLLSRYLGHFIGNMAFRAPLPLVISARGILLWIAIVVVGSILATVFPARRASNITTREALAYE